MYPFFRSNELFVLTGAIVGREEEEAERAYASLRPGYAERKACSPADRRRRGSRTAKRERERETARPRRRGGSRLVTSHEQRCVHARVWQGP